VELHTGERRARGPRLHRRRDFVAAALRAVAPSVAADHRRDVARSRQANSSTSPDCVEASRSSPTAVCTWRSFTSSPSATASWNATFSPTRYATARRRVGAGSRPKDELDRGRGALPGKRGVTSRSRARLPSARVSRATGRPDLPGVPEKRSAEARRARSNRGKGATWGISRGGSRSRRGRAHDEKPLRVASRPTRTERGRTSSAKLRRPLHLGTHQPSWRQRDARAQRSRRESVGRSK